MLHSRQAYQYYSFHNWHSVLTDIGIRFLYSYGISRNQSFGAAWGETIIKAQAGLQTQISF